LEGLRPSHEIVKSRDNEAYWNGVLLCKGKLPHGVERRNAQEYLAPRTRFGIRKFESMGDGKERHPLIDRHRETVFPTKRRRKWISPRRRTINLPLIEECEQSFELEDRDVVQMNQTTRRLGWAGAGRTSIGTGVAALVILKYITKFGGVSR
jgi:hypothetical protein